MKRHHLLAIAICLFGMNVLAEDKETAPKLVEGTGEGWVELGGKDFVPVNGDKDTWKFEDGVLYCTGKPTGVTRSKKQYTNFELVVTWRHMKPAGNSGVFIWTSPSSLEGLKPGRLPQEGIEIQVLDPAFKERYEKRTGKKGDWFTTHGDVFPVGKAKMKPFPPTSPNGSRGFPKKETTKSSGMWNHYYIHAKDGEVRLSVNGVEVSGGENCQPKTGYLCLESEGSPIEFKNIRIREMK